MNTRATAGEAKSATTSFSLGLTPARQETAEADTMRSPTNEATWLRARCPLSGVTCGIGLGNSGDLKPTILRAASSAGRPETNLAGGQDGSPLERAGTALARFTAGPPGAPLS
jgi:hypothetical protein